jgi:hypothetical protein
LRCNLPIAAFAYPVSLPFARLLPDPLAAMPPRTRARRRRWLRLTGQDDDPQI